MTVGGAVGLVFLDGVLRQRNCLDNRYVALQGPTIELGLVLVVLRIVRQPVFVPATIDQVSSKKRKPKDEKMNKKLFGLCI